MCFYLKMHKNAFGGQAPPEMLGKSTVLLRPSNRIKGKDEEEN